MPQDFRSATLKIYPTMAASGTASGAKLQLLKYPDLEWSDGSAPTWSEVFVNDYSTVNARNAGNDPMRAKATLIDEIQVESASGSIAAGVPVSFDVGAAVRAARQAGESHVTLLIAPYRTSTIGLMSKERAFGVSCASQMTFTLHDWTRGIVINFR